MARSSKTATATTGTMIDGLVDYWRFCDTNRSAVAKKHFEYRVIGYDLF